MEIITTAPMQVTMRNKMDIAYNTHDQAHNKLPINGGDELVPVLPQPVWPQAIILLLGASVS